MKFLGQEQEKVFFTLVELANGDSNLVEKALRNYGSGNNVAQMSDLVDYIIENRDKPKLPAGWLPVNEHPFPIFEETQTDFLAAWVNDEGDIDGIEWYTFDGISLWNQNSHNRNDFDEGEGPTHWMPVPNVK